MFETEIPDVKKKPVTLFKNIDLRTLYRSCDTYQLPPICVL